MVDDELTREWLQCADNLFEIGKRIYLESDMTMSNMGTADPKVVALTLLCRSMSNFRGALMVARENLIVEARTLVRCCYENLIWIDGLAARGIEFVKEIAQDDIAVRKSRGAMLLDWVGRQEARPDYADKLEGYLAKLKEEHGKSQKLNFKRVSETGVLKDAYIFYGQLSTDAAHPSATSLSRHITRNVVSGDEQEIRIEAEPKTRPDELIETLEFACKGLMGVLVGTNQILGGTPSGKVLNAICDQFAVLAKKNRERMIARRARAP